MLDLRQSPAGDQAIARHANECPPCARLLTDFLDLEAALRTATLDSKRRLGEAGWAPAVRTRPRLGHVASQGPASAAFPKHPASRERRTLLIRYAQAAVLLLAVGFLGFNVLRQRAQRIAMLPVPDRTEASSLFASADDWGMAKPGAFRPVSSYRSLEQCYELTSELPGVKPLQTSILVALDWWQQYFRLSPVSEPVPRYHEQGFGLNPLFADTRYQA